MEENEIILFLLFVVTKYFIIINYLQLKYYIALSQKRITVYTELLVT